MNKAIKYLALASAMVLGLAACVQKAPQYEPADAVGNAEVFFSPNLPATYNLKGNEGAFSVTVNRVQNTGSLTVNLNSSAPEIFSVPSSVTFDSGAKTAAFDITFDPASLEEDVTYPFTVTLANEVTPYGASEYSFTASIPAAWIKFATGTLTEDWWGEVEPKMTLWYQDIDDHTRLCKIENCFGHDTGPSYDVQDYVFYWDTETNYLSIPMRYMGYTNANGFKVYYGDAESFFRDVYEYDDELMQKNGYKDVADYAYNAQGYTRPYYDGNGGFYLASWYFFSKEDNKGSGYSFGDSVDTFICDGFVRITDYNDEKHFGASSALYEGIMESLLFSTDGEPIEFEQSLRYDAEYEFDAEKFDPEKDDVVMTTYYLADYFDEGQCLAFSAPIPELIEDGSEIVDVDNEQAAGVKLIGYDLYAKIKKGTITVPEAEEGEEVFPTFEITVAVYTKDAEGNVVHDFGSVKEVFTALEYGKDNYTLDDLYGAYKEDYLGDWVFFSKDFFDDGAEYAYDGVIEDAGQDEDGAELLKITNLSGVNGLLGLKDEMIAKWDSDYGLVFLYGQDLDPITYQGQELGVSVYPFDPDAQKSYSQANSLIGGITEDGVFALVNRYTGVNLAGLNYNVPALEASLAIVYYIYGVPAGGNSFKHVGFNNYEKLARNAKAAGRGVTVVDRKIGKSSAKKAVKSVTPTRTLNVNNCVRAEKEVVSIAVAPLK